MRSSGNLPLYSLFLLLLATFTAAWPWPSWLPELDSLVVRQDSGNNDGTSSAAQQTASPSKTSAGSAAETGSTSASGTVKSVKNTNSASQTGTKTNSQSGTAKTTSKARTTSYDARLPAGGISMLTPAALDGSKFYKIGDFVTFGWNYTSLSATPTAVDIMATCTANQVLYTIAANQTVGNSTGSVTWDTGAYQQTALTDPLLTETYTLIIYDAASSISATAAAGYLAVFNSYTFGMYVPQAYTPLNEFICATCSGAMGDMEKRALGMVVGVSVITVLSFTWFVSGSGVIW